MYFKHWLRATCCVSLSVIRAAQADQLDDLFQMPLEELLNVPVSGVTKVESDFLMAPASITVFDRKTMDLSGADYLSELLTLAPGVHVGYHDDGIYPAVTMRGRSIGTAGREVLFLLDGNRVENWFTGGGFLSYSPINLKGLERVEIIRGAVSQLYGSNAYTGVINMVTADNLNNTSLRVDGQGALDLVANVSGKAGEFKQKLFINLIDDPGHEFTFNRPQSGEPYTLIDGKNAYSVNYGIGYGNWYFSAQANYNKTDTFYTASRFSEDFNLSERSYYTTSIKNTLDHWQDIKLETRLGYRYFNWNLDIEVLPPNSLTNASSPSSSDAFRASTVSNSDQEFWLTSDVDWAINTKSSVRLGLEWREIKKNEFKLTNNFDLTELSNREFPVTYYGNFTNTTTTLPKASDRLLGVVAQNISKITSNDEITIGLRYDNFELTGEHFSPRIAWVHKVGENNSLKFIYSEALRVPNSNEYFLVNNPILLGNAELEPENIATTELIWVSESSSYRSQLGVFYNHFENPIQTSIAGETNDLRQFNNLDDNYNIGLEAYYATQFGPRWIFRVNLSHMLENPSDQFRQPDTLATLSTIYRLNTMRWNYGIRYVGERQEQRDSVGNFIKVGATVTHFIKYIVQLNKRHELKLSIDNVFDLEFEDPNVGSVENRVPRRGREININWKFDF